MLDPGDHPLSLTPNPIYLYARCLTFQADGFSLRWYGELLSNPNWRLAIGNSIVIAFASTLLSVVWNAGGSRLSSPFMPFRKSVTSLVLLPLISRLSSSRRAPTSSIRRSAGADTPRHHRRPHAAGDALFVVITVTATLQASIAVYSGRRQPRRHTGADLFR